jgi:hypothetical protein
MRFPTRLAVATVALAHAAAYASPMDDVLQKRNTTTPPPQPEPITIFEVPLPPSIANTSVGACSLEVNPRGTGCIVQSGLIAGSFTPDGNHITAAVTFIGAPAAPANASIYTGLHFILLKADGTEFPNGDAWKCITCGVPAANQVGVTPLGDYPQTFIDGTRAMYGANIIDCGSAQLASIDCTPDKVHIYPIRFSNTANDDGSGEGGSIRELRIHPDNVHLGFSSYSISDGTLGEYGFFGRLQFNSTGARYDVINVTLLFNADLPQPVSTEGSQLIIDPAAISVGELRGFTGTGQEATYVGYPVESCNIDLFAVDLTTGTVRRITAHPEYADPISVSPDDKWQVVLDTRGTNRQMFVAGLRSIPPITDLVSVGFSASSRNNGIRRFFEPWLIDHDGDRGLYFGQKINAAGDGSPGSVNDPNWNAGADPRWSLDGTRITYYQWLAHSPACGGSNPLACEDSPYPDGRQERVMVAHLTSRQPIVVEAPAEISDEVPWATKYVPGMVIPGRPVPAAGQYTLQGSVQGYADVSILWDSSNRSIQTVSATYHNFSNDGLNFVNGDENVTSTSLSLTFSEYDWYSNITSTGVITGTKLTSPDGFHASIDVLVNDFSANGTLTTTIDGVSYLQPCNGC